MHKKIIVVSACCLVSTLVFGFIAYKSIFEYFIKNQISLSKHNYVREFYLKYPIPLDFRVNFFNVTNPHEVQRGGIPVLKEIGPYCYDLYKERINVVDNETEDSLTYNPKDLYLFNQERSGDLKEDDFVTIIHPLALGIVNYVSAKIPSVLSILNLALPELFPGIDSIYLTAKVRDILFDGMTIDCNSKDFTVTAICNKLKTQIPGIKIGKDDNLKYSIFGQQNGTLPTTLKVLRGIKNSKDLGRVIAVDNATETKIWDKEECNEFRGTDGWIFPPLSGEERQLWIHATNLCMNLHADFVEDTTSNDVRVRKYYADFESSCDNCTKHKCLPSGLVDATKCLKVPIYISLPHFLRSDEMLLDDVHGLKPNTKRHVTRILLQETLSLPMEAQIRIQFNFPVVPTSQIDFMQDVPSLVHPVMWIELGVVLDGWILHTVKAFFYFLTALEVLKYISVVTSVAGLGYGIYVYSKSRKLYSIKKAFAR